MIAEAFQKMVDFVKNTLGVSDQVAKFIVIVAIIVIIYLIFKYFK